MTTRFFGVLVSALVLSATVLVAVPASAVPVYISSQYAGARAGKIHEWSNPVVDHDPEAVEATWTIPCLPENFTDAAGRVQGAYDQWIGLQTADGAQYVRVGIRSYHLDLGWFQTTGYFAWMVNTTSPTGRSIVELPEHVSCGTIITARVIWDGRYCLKPESVGRCLTGGDAAPLTEDRRYRLPSLGHAAFILERFTGGTGHMPYFGRAEFRDAKVLYVRNGAPSGALIGGSDVVIDLRQMRSSYTTDNVAISSVSPSGAFSLYQSPPS